MTKLRAEEASLRDSLSKLGALNESLAQDKLELNRLIAQVDSAPAPCPLYQGDTAEACQAPIPCPVCPAVYLLSCLPFSVLCILEGCCRVRLYSAALFSAPWKTFLHPREPPLD